MKRILSICLVICMLLTTLTLPVFAADGEYSSDSVAAGDGYYFRIGEEGAAGTLYYKTLADAISVVNGVATTIYQIQDNATSTAMTGKIGPNEPITIKGAGATQYTLNIPDMGFYSYESALTFENLKLACSQRAFRPNGDSWGTGAVNHSTAVSTTFKNCTVTIDGTSWFMCFDNASHTVNFESGSTLVLAKGNPVFTNARSFAITVNFAEGSTVEYKAAAKVNNTPASIQIIDNGATWKIANGLTVTLPSINKYKGSTSINGWKLSNGQTAVFNTAFTTTAEVTASPAYVSETIDNVSDAEAVEAGMFFRIGESGTGTYYKTLELAIKAVEGTATTIYQIADFTSVAINNLIGTDEPITIEGTNATERYKLTLPDTGFYLYKSNVTFRNLEITAKGRAFRPHNWGETATGVTTTFENCVINTATTWLACLDVAGDSLVFSNTTLNSNVTSNNVIASNSISNTVTLVNGSKVILGGNSNVFFQGTVSGCNYTIHVDGTSSITATGAYAGKLLNVSNGTCNVNLDAGATLYLNNSAANSTLNTFFSGNANFVVNDGGAIWKVNATIQKAGVTLPKLTKVGENTNVIGWVVNGALYKNECALPANTEATADMTVTPVALDLSMKPGASIRLDSPYGIRFTVDVAAALKATLGESATYGAIIAPTANLASFTTKEALAAGSYVDTAGGFKWIDANETSYRVALVGIPENYDAVRVQFSAIAYVTVTYADGTTATFYSEASDSRSLYDVAAAYKASEGYTANAVIEQILGYTAAN